MIFKSRRIKELEARIERLEAALLWTESRNYASTNKTYRIFRVIEMLGVNSSHAENLITKYMRNNVNNEGN